MIWYNRYGTYQNTATIRLCCLVKLKWQKTHLSDRRTWTWRWPDLRTNVRYSDAYPDKTSVIQMRIRTNVRYSDHWTRTTFSYSPVWTKLQLSCWDRGQMVYLSDRRQMISLKCQKRRPEDCSEIFASGNFLKVKCDKFSQLPGTWSQFGAFNFRCWCASGAVCEQRSTRRVVPTSVPTCLPYSLRARSGSAGYSFQ